MTLEINEKFIWFLRDVVHSKYIITHFSSHILIDDSMLTCIYNTCDKTCIIINENLIRGLRKVFPDTDRYKNIIIFPLTHPILPKPQVNHYNSIGYLYYLK